MRLAPAFLIILFAAGFLAGCDTNQYQIVTGSDGALYRFNKKTGELSMVMEDKKVVRLAEGAKSEVMKEKADRTLERPVIWNESRYPLKDLRVRMETVWRENKLCYKITVYPYKSLEKMFMKKKQDYVYSLMKPGFNIELVDKNGFMVKEIKVILWNMTKIALDDGSTKELFLNSQTDCSKQSYKSIGGYSVKWSIEPDLIDDEK